MRDERRKDEGKIEAGRRQVGGRSEEFHLNGHSNGMQNPKFPRVNVKISEFKSYLYEKIIKNSLVLQGFFCPANIQKNSYK
jgi:hypothetical protein